MNTLLFLSGGKGLRTNKNIPKQYISIAGKPMFIHSLEKFDRIEGISEIVIVCEKNYIEYIRNICKQFNIKKKIFFADAGNTRQQSVYNGLKIIRTPSVIIHEAARPFITIEEIENLISIEEANVVFAIKIPFTVLKGGEFIEQILNRDELFNIQLPQKFSVENLLQAHEIAILREQEFTDDSSLLFNNSSMKIKIIEGSSFNIKITNEVDFILADEIHREYFSRR